MKLRRSSPPRQFLFTIGAIFALFLAPAQAQDRLNMNTNPPSQQNVKVLRVDGANIMVETSSGGQMGVPLSSVRSVVMKAPAEFTEGSQAVIARDYAKALPLIKGVVEKFKGLPVDWAQQAVILLGDIHVGLNQLEDAEAAYAQFQKLYPRANALQVNVGRAGIALAKKDLKRAREILEPVVQDARKSLTPPPARAAAFSQAFYLLGQVAETEGLHAQALEYYLYAVTIYYHDAKSAAGAQARVDELRKNEPSLFLP